MRNTMLWLMAIMLLAAAALAGCTAGSTTTGTTPAQEQTPAENAPAPAEKVTLEFWDMVWGPAEYIGTAEGLIQQFNDAHENIEFTYQSIPWENFTQAYTTAIASDSAPDVSTGGGYQQHQFAVMGEILPLDSIGEEWEAAGNLDDFMAGSMDQFQWDGQQIGIPWNCDPRAIYYRVDMFAEKNIEPPTTWEEFEAAAIAMTDGDVYGFISSGSDINAYWAMSNYVFGFGGRLFDENMKPGYNIEPNLQAMELIQRLVNAGVYPSGTVSYINEDSQKLFLQGKAAMIYNNAEFGAIIQQQEDPELVNNIDILPAFPAPDGNTYTTGGMNAIMAYKQTEHPEECKTFIKWWSENNNSLWSEGHVGAFSVRDSTLGIDYFQNDKYKKLLAEKILPHFIATNRPVPNAFPEMSGVEGELVLRDAYQLALDTSNDPKDIAVTIDGKLQAILDAGQ